MDDESTDFFKVAFKQICSPDIMAFFANYGSSYIDWLNNYSCNILLDVDHSTVTALVNCAMKLPSPPPTTDVTTNNNEDNK
eukprot:12391980-Ditylum_brightwellii.AAC.1